MNENEMREEIERLRRQCAETSQSRDRLRTMLCALLNVESPEAVERHVLEMMAKPGRGIDDIIEELEHESASLPEKSKQIPA